MIKNLLLATTLVCSTLAFSQKDIAVTMNTPADGSTVQSNADVQLSFTVENAGTTDLIATDSVFYTLGINNGGSFLDLFGGLLLADRMDAVVTPGGTWDVDFTVPQVIFDGLNFPSGDLEANISLCVVALLYEDTSAVPATEVSDANNASCSNVLFVADYASLNENQINETNVFPNPAQDIVTIETTAKGLKTVEVVNLAGKRVANQNFEADNTILDVSGLKDGLYIYTISVNNTIVASNKLMIK